MMEISIKGISFAYDSHSVLESLSLTLPQGSRTALMGSSGRGKTTLLRLLAGLEQPLSGEIAGLPEDGASVAFQENRLLPWFTVLENLALAVPDKTREQYRELLGQLGLAGWEDALPDKLSGGMARRVSLARAIAYDAPLLLLDEPFSGLDETTREQVAAVVLEYARGRTLVVVVHDPQEAALLDAKILSLD